MKFPRNARVFRGQLDASPFVGVLFLVVIFLLLHSSLVFTPGVRIELPKSPELPGPTNATLTVAVDRDGHLYYDNQLAAEDTLKAALQRRRAERVTLVVLADRNVRNETLVRLLNLARDAGIDDALLATRPPVRAQAGKLAP
jgi:biopolymer transport protein ExbD